VVQSEPSIDGSVGMPGQKLYVVCLAEHQPLPAAQQPPAQERRRARSQVSARAAALHTAHRCTPGQCHSCGCQLACVSRRRRLPLLGLDLRTSSAPAGTPCCLACKRAAARGAAAAANGSREHQPLAASAQQRPAGRETPTKRRQQCSGPAPDAGATAKPGRQARRRLRNRAAAAQNSTADAPPLAPQPDTALVHDDAAGADVNDMEHSTVPKEQLQGSPDLCAAEIYAAIKPSSVPEVRITVRCCKKVAQSTSFRCLRWREQQLLCCIPSGRYQHSLASAGWSNRSPRGADAWRRSWQCQQSRCSACFA
jgi:hypothetical protein